jgi:sodium transport system permease protein
VAKTTRASEEKPLDLPLAGREHAPNLAAFLEENGARLLPAPADPEQAVRANTVDLVLSIPPEFGERLRSGRPAPVRLYVDESRQQAQASVQRARRLLEAWSARTGSLRLAARGIDPAVASPLAVETVDLSTPESRAALLLSILPYFVILSLFIGGMYVAIDITAGERERQSLEPLLLHPVPREAVVMAKIAAVAGFASVALMETLAGFGLVPLALPLDRYGLSIRLDPGVLARALVLVLPLLLLAAALMVVVAMRARSFKAAQASMSFLVMVPAIPSMLLALMPVKLETWMLFLPGFAEQLLLVRLLRGEPVPLAHAAATMGASLAVALLLALAAVRLFESEKVAFAS